MVNERRLVEQFMELVRTDSETKHEQAICALLKRKFADLGLTVQEDDSAARTGHGAGNLIAFLDASPGLAHVPSLLFTAHMDTVVPGRGVKPRLDDDGYIRSDGTTILGSDDKAGIAAILEAIVQLKERAVPHGPIQFVITAGEESGLVGAAALDPALLNADYGFALDSSGPVGEIVTAAPFQCAIEVKVYGKSAHAGLNPEDGISAIQVASQAISRMPLGRIDRETTANIGSFHGGRQTNIVCDYAEIRAEARSLDQAKLARQVAAMRDAFEAAAAKHGTSVEFTDRLKYPGYRIAEEHPLVDLVSRAVRRIGRTPKTVRSGGGSDANLFNALGVPTVNLAVGYEHIHTTREQMPVPELVKTAELVLAVIEEAAGR
jgi:tripeptide aminopeptidase